MKKLTRFLVPLLLVVFIICSIGWYLFVYDRGFTRDMLLQQARHLDLKGSTRLSSFFYDLAYQHSGQDESVAIELANQYKADGNYTKAEYTLTNAIYDSPTPELYTALCKTFVEQDKLLDAVNLLTNISNSQLKEQMVRPVQPSANYEPGFYNQYIEVKLTASPGDTIYYSTDGEYPSIQNPAYSEPIRLSNGETIIRAISVSQDGLVSPVSVLSFTVGGVIEPAIFMDAAMEQAIRSAVGANDEKILYTDDLWEITEFTVPEGVSSFEDLRLMPYLRSLTIQDYTITSLSDLANLSRLETLTITGCRFTDTEALSIVNALPNLISLTVSDCGLSTIADLAGALKLEYLDLSSNGGLRDLSPLSEMTALKEVYLQHNAITSVEKLISLTNLEKLDVSYNSISSLSHIANCVKLTWLNADGNSLTDTIGISSLTLLEYLSLDYNKLTSVSPLAACTELKELSFSNNELRNLSSLGPLVKLETLDFSNNLVEFLPEWQEGCALRNIYGSYNALQSIDSLAKLSNICYIYMDYNKLQNVDALADCYNLVQLNVFGNDIKEVSKLTDHDIIVNYDPT